MAEKKALTPEQVEEKYETIRPAIDLQGATGDDDKKDKWLNKLLNRAQKRAKKHHLEFNLTRKYLDQLWEENEGRCALTDLPFKESKERKDERRPFIPSLDRIDCNKGYTKGNVRLVCVAVNMALFTWGEGVFDEIVQARQRKLLKSNKKEHKKKLETRGFLESYFNLGDSWFKRREKENLPVPEANYIKYDKNKTPHAFYYDLNYVHRWLEKEGFLND